MTSQINISNIDVTYPVAGQDNDSQGFRDNFSAIYTALGTAKSEITDLQNTTAKVNTTTNFDGNIIQNASLQNVYYLGTSDTPVSGSVTLNYALGSYQTQNISTNTVFTVSTSSSWPDSPNYANLKLAVAPTSTATMTVNFDAGLGTLHKEPSFKLPYTSTFTATIFFDIWTADGGSNVFVKFLGTYTTV